LLLAFRIVNALTLRTFFQPDEYFQSLEPAWQLAFGADSGAWITWVNSSLRSLSHGPWPISRLFRLRRWLTIRAGVEKPIAVVPASSTFCGCLSGGGKIGNAVRTEFVR
jgi:phosphatidylinositol glycan class B